MNTTANPQPDRTLWEGVWEKSTVKRPIHEAILEALEHVVDVRDVRILEIGCGSAVDSAELAVRGARAIAIDYSLHALRHARQHAASRGVTVPLSSADMFQLPFADGTFDVAFSQGLMEHFTDPMPGIREQVRVLRPGGLLCVDVPQTYSLLTRHKQWHMRRGTWFAGWETNYSLPQLEALLREAGLEVRHSYGWLYFPALLYGFRNLHTLNERYKLPVWIGRRAKAQIERGWQWLEKQRWYYRWMGCVGVIGCKVAAHAD